MTSKHRKNVCDTAFETLNIILLHDNDLGTIRVPHGTHKAQYVKHIKLTTLERGHFDFFLVIRQQLLTKIIIIKKSALPSSF